MNANDAGQLKNKFDDLMKVAEAFGNESKQLSQTRKSLNDLTSDFQGFSTQIAALASSCQEYLNAVNHLVSDEFTQQIKQDISRVSGLVRQYQQQSQDLTKQYRENIALFEENMSKIVKQQNTVIYEVEKATKANAATIDAAFQQLETSGVDIKAAFQKFTEAQQTASAEEVARLLDILSTLANIQSAQINLSDTVSQVQTTNKDINSRLQSDSTQIITALKNIEQHLDKYTAEISNLIQYSLDEKIIYLETQFQTSTREILDATTIINEKTDFLSNSNSQIKDLFLELMSKYTDQTNQLANHNKVMHRYWIAGFGILFVLSILGFFI